MRFRFRLSDHIFKIILAAAGILTMGIFGLFFGILGGALLDQLLHTYRKNSGIRRFLRSGASAGTGFFGIAAEDRLAASVMTVIWYICRGEPARAEFAAEAVQQLFPALPSNIIELLKEEDKTGFRSAAEYFGTAASEEEIEKLNNLICSCGLEAAAVRIIAEEPEAAGILSKAGININRRRENYCADASDADYLILGVEPGTDADELKRIYHKLAADFHPDGGRELSPEQQRITEDAFKRIQAAYERISRE